MDLCDRFEDRTAGQRTDPSTRLLDRLRPAPRYSARGFPCLFRHRAEKYPSPSCATAVTTFPLPPPSAPAANAYWIGSTSECGSSICSSPVRGLKNPHVFERRRLAQMVDGARWFLWHGQVERSLWRLAALRRETGLAGKRIALVKLVGYLERSKRWLVNYAWRRARQLPISSAGAESVVDHVTGQRMKRNGHMRWTR